MLSLLSNHQSILVILLSEVGPVRTEYDEAMRAVDNAMVVLAGKLKAVRAAVVSQLPTLFVVAPVV